MEEKYARLKNFNDKLVKMYQEVRDSRDRLTKEITKFIETSINTPFKKLIQQIDVGLVRSFVIKLKSSDGKETERKMEFSIVELMDSKIILGILSNLEK